jgi:hypothetical protein
MAKQLTIDIGIIRKVPSYAEPLNVNIGKTKFSNDSPNNPPQSDFIDTVDGEFQIIAFPIIA